MLSSLFRFNSAFSKTKNKKFKSFANLWVFAYFAFRLTNNYFRFLQGFKISGLLFLTPKLDKFRFLREFVMQIRRMPCRPIVLSGPSGGGKSTILSRAMKEYPDSFAFSVSHTTRQPRDGEKNGTHYYFTEKSVMDEMIKNGEFIEHASFGGNSYGTSKKAVEDVEKTGKICVLDIELQGVRNIKNSHLDARYILIRAPSIKLLEDRLRARGTETEETLRKRLKHAEEDLIEVEKNPSLFDQVIINDDLERAYLEFIATIKDDLEKTAKI